MYFKKLDDGVNVFSYLVLVSKQNKIRQFVILEPTFLFLNTFPYHI
jgi:hypothetical protein